MPISLDRFGGIKEFRCPGKATGYFRVEKIGRRWVFCTPEGHPFWLRSVYNVVPPGNLVETKYGGQAWRWGTNINNHLKSWGFNALGEYTSTSAAIPIGAYGGGDGNPVKLPFILLLTPAMNAMQNPRSIGLAEAVKDIIGGVPESTYNDWRGPLVDVYDPKFATAVEAEVDYWMRAFTGGFADKPWVIGITVDDADKLFGFKSRGDAPVIGYLHPGFMIATTRFSRPGFKDPKLHTKYAWIEFLKAKYGGQIAALNAAWRTGGFYTSFDSAGGYGVGTGVIDEDGRHKGWMGKDAKTLAGASPGFRADVDAFLYEFCKKYAQILVSKIRAVDRNHLIFGPAALNNYGAKARDEVLKGLADGGIQVFQLNYNPKTGDMSENNTTYDLTGKPAFIWYSVTGQADSAMRNHPLIYGQPDFGTQAARAERYGKDIWNFLNARGANGDFYVLGFDWWDLWDMPNEGVNWGLYTVRENAYDGKEAVTARGKDPWGYPVGGEAADYGDFLSAVRLANQNAMQVLLAQLKEQ